jgi:chromatin structure-remodeling complex protein RSC7
MLEKLGKLLSKTPNCSAIANISSRFNSVLTAVRRENSEGHYDIHTNTVQWPNTTQPTHARWETVEPGRGHGAKDRQGDPADGINGAEHDTDQELSTMFKHLDPIYPRNFMICDFTLEGATESKFGPPGLDTDPQSLSSVPRDVLDELPAECRHAFEKAKQREMAWRARWKTESADGYRGRFMPTVEWFP